jgi:hypothetical protein
VTTYGYPHNISDLQLSKTTSHKNNLTDKLISKHKLFVCTFSLSKMNPSREQIFDFVQKEDYKHLPLETPDEIFPYVDNSLMPNCNFERQKSFEFLKVLLRLFEKAAYMKFTDAVGENLRKTKNN